MPKTAVHYEEQKAEQDNERVEDLFDAYMAEVHDILMDAYDSIERKVRDLIEDVYSEESNADEE